MKKFSELENDQVFALNGVEYRKITPVKISCCKSINAVAHQNENQRIFVQPDTPVAVDK